jgi:hypothetical protein
MPESEHLARARQFLAIAEAENSKREAYKMAADEIAAEKQETGETNENLARFLGRKKDYVTKLLAWRKSGFEAETPFLMDKQATNRAAISHTKKVLREAPMEQVEQLLSELPKERQEKIAAATGDHYMQAKHQELDRRKQQTDAEKAEELRDQVAMKKPFFELAAGLSAESIGGLLTAAAESLQQLAEQGMLTTKAMRLIEVYDEQWRSALEWARELSGEDGV